MASVRLWLACGQSNNQGTPPGKGNTAAGYKAAPTNRYPGRALEWEDGFTPELMDLADGRSPLAGWGTSEPYKALPGSAWPAFFNTFCRYSADKQVLVRCAIGGTAVLAANTNTESGKGDWSPTATGNQARFTAAINRATAGRAAIAAAGDTVTQINVLWHGGERDALIGNGLTDGTFEQQFGDLAGRFRTALSWPTLKVFVARIGRPDYTAAPTYAQYEDELELVRSQQDAACAKRDGMVMAYTDCINFPAWGLMSAKDNIHYSQDGYNLMGEGMAYFVAQHLGLAELTPPPPEFLTSQTARRLMMAPPVPPLPRTYAATGTYTWTVPAGVSSVQFVGWGPGGNGGNGSITSKGGAGGGGAKSTKTLAVIPGQQFTIVMTAGGSVQHCTVTRVSDNVVVWRAAAGFNGAAGNANSDGAGGQASACIGDTTVSGQAGGVSGIDNGGNGAAPGGGAGGVGPGPNAGAAPGGGGAGANLGTGQVGGAGALGRLTITRLA